MCTLISRQSKQSKQDFIRPWQDRTTKYDTGFAASHYSRGDVGLAPELGALGDALRDPGSLGRPSRLSRGAAQAWPEPC